MNFTASTPAAAPVQSSSQNFDDIALNNFRAVTAKRLLESKQNIPHYYLTIDFELDNAMKYRFVDNRKIIKFFFKNIFYETESEKN